MQKSKFQELTALYNPAQYRKLYEEMSFADYVELTYKKPKLIRSAWQFLYDAITCKGSERRKRQRKTYVHYNFFDDPEIPIFGLEETLEKLVKVISGGASWYGPDRRVILLHGPVGSSKSTICRLLKKGLEQYSRTDAGAWYTHKWVNLPTGLDGLYTSEEDESPLHEQPLKLLPESLRNTIVGHLNDIHREQALEENRYRTYELRIEGDLNPRCKFFMDELMKIHDYDLHKVLKEHILIIRKTHSESARVGIATFQPKDEKNQDSTELNGDTDYSRISIFGTDSDPRSFAFDGEFPVGNRGIVEFVEMLKLETAFLYDLLTASQEKKIKPKKFAQIHIDEVIIGHTNHPEYVKLQENNFMEALRDRTIKIDVPYLLRASEEIKIFEHSYGPDKITQHIAPHTLEIAALWAVLTRLHPDKNSKLSLVDKAKLYDGRAVENFTEDNIKELRNEFPDEGMDTGVSSRYIQDKIASCLAAENKKKKYVSTFEVMNEIKEGLSHSSLINNKEEIGKYMTCVDLVMKELDDILKDEVQKVLVGDEQAAIRLCTNYIDNVVAYVEKSPRINPSTEKEELPNEQLMRAIERKIGVTDSQIDQFREQLCKQIGILARKGETFDWKANEQLRKALQAHLFSEVQDHIKISSLQVGAAVVVDPEVQAKIDAIKQRMIKNHGYTEESATDVLDYVSSIFARGVKSE